HLVKLLQVEAIPKDLLRPGASAVPGDMADLVAAGLTNRSAIALDLTLDARAGKARGRDHIVNRLLSAPALGIEAGVDHQAARPEQVGLEVTGALDVLVGAKLVGQLLGVKR